MSEIKLDYEQMEKSTPEQVVEFFVQNYNFKKMDLILFIKEDISWDVFPYLNKQDFKELGIKLGHWKKLENVCEISRVNEFLKDKRLFPEGLKTMIGERGTNISGGQKQRLSIARAIARDPEIYIFDDSFSALDYKTDSSLRKDLKKYTKDATNMIVAQRIGTIMNADKIMVLDKGECVGIGTHKELLKSCDIYREIALSQLSEEELNHA